MNFQLDLLLDLPNITVKHFHEIEGHIDHSQNKFLEIEMLDCGYQRKAK